MIPAKRNESPYKIVWKKNPPRLGHLVEFGRIGYVTDRTKIKSKMSPRSFKAIMIGYAKEHSKDTFRMFNPSTRKVIMTRDIIWSDWEPAQPEEEMPVEEVKENRKNETAQ